MHCCAEGLALQCLSLLSVLKSQNTILVSRVSRIFLYFWWEGREGEKNTSGHSNQLSVQRRM